MHEIDNTNPMYLNIKK